MVFGDETWGQFVLLCFIAISSEEGILSLEILEGGVDVDEDDH